MAAKLRHWKEKDGRYWARISIPEDLRPLFQNKTQLTEALGGDRKAAIDKHPAAVARLKSQLAMARHALSSALSQFQGHGPSTQPPTTATAEPKVSLTPERLQQIAWDHHTSMLQDDAEKRASMPTQQEIEEELNKAHARIEAGGADVTKSVSAAFNTFLDYELKGGARHFYREYRSRRLAALRTDLRDDNYRHVAKAVDETIERSKLIISPGSSEWRDVASVIMRAEIDALDRTLELDEGIFGGNPKDPIIRPPKLAEEKQPAVSLMALFESYILKRQSLGYHQDGGAKWLVPIKSLIAFVGHDDARRIKHKDLCEWRDGLIKQGKSPKTVRDKYLAAVRAVLTKAKADRILPTNEMEDVDQELPKKVYARERGFTTPEAVQILKVSLAYHPPETTHPSHRESAHITAAKRWVPLLCAFTGARVTEITQLRRQDIFESEGRWIARITPDAGSVKTGSFRDVPLHRQILDLGFPDFVKNANGGPLFHAAQAPSKYLKSARATSGRLSEWLQDLDLVPEGVQPNYGWRHRFKTLGRELGMSDRVLDAIQGHRTLSGPPHSPDRVQRQNRFETPSHH